jgi:hypothetical protein
MRGLAKAAGREQVAQAWPQQSKVPAFMGSAAASPRCAEHVLTTSLDYVAMLWSGINRIYRTANEPLDAPDGVAEGGEFVDAVGAGHQSFHDEAAPGC